MRTRPLVFVSSTSDLVAEREALRTRLPPTYHPYLFEHDRARRLAPRRRCRAVIGRCDAFVGVYGSMRGSDLPRDAQGRSIVEWELDVAFAREELPIMAFLGARPDDPSVEPGQRELLARLTDFDDGQWCQFYSSPDELADGVRASLNEWLVEVWAGTRRRLPALRARLRRAIVVLSAAAVVVPVAATWLWHARGMPPSWALVACTLSALVIGGGMLLVSAAEVGGSHDD